jgi:hypothetical protein
MTGKDEITFQQPTTFRLLVESELQPGVYEPATAMHLRVAGWMTAEEALDGSKKAIDMAARHMLDRLWRALDRPEPGSAIETSFAEALLLVERRVHSDVSRGWRRAIGKALGVEPDLIHHTPEWAVGQVHVMREQVRKDREMLYRLWAALGRPEEEGDGNLESALRLVAQLVHQPVSEIEQERDFLREANKQLKKTNASLQLDYERAVAASVDSHKITNREPPPWLPELLDALGWKSGTMRNALHTVRQFAESNNATSGPPWLPKLLDALGWQGGTADQAIYAVRLLVATGRDLSAQIANAESREPTT